MIVTFRWLVIDSYVFVLHVGSQELLCHRRGKSAHGKNCMLKWSGVSSILYPRNTCTSIKKMLLLAFDFENNWFSDIEKKDTNYSFEIDWAMQENQLHFIIRTIPQLSN